MAYQTLILLAIAGAASAQTYASSYNSVADPLQIYPAPSSLSSPGSPLYGGSALPGTYDHQHLLHQPGYDVTEAPQEPENPPSPVPPPSAPVYYSNLPQDPAPPPLLPPNQPQLPLLPHQNLLPSAPGLSAPSAPTQLTSHSSTSFSSPFVSYQH